MEGRRLLEIQKTVLDRRCKSFGSSDRTGVGGCGSQSGSNSAVSGWWEERENTGGRVRHEFVKLLIGFSTARVKRWNRYAKRGKNERSSDFKNSKMCQKITNYETLQTNYSSRIKKLFFSPVSQCQ